MKALWWQVVEASGARIFSLAMMMSAVFITARTLGPQGQGTVAAATAWVVVFATASALSLGQVAQFRAQLRRGESWLPDAMGGLLLLLVVLTIGAWVVAGIAFGLSHGRIFRGLPPLVFGIAFLALPFLIGEDFTSNLLTAVGQLRSYNLAQVVGRSLGLAFTLSFVVWLRFGVCGALVAQFLGQAVVVVIGMAALWRVAGRKIRLNPMELRGVLNGAVKLHLNSIGTILLAQTSVLALNYFTSKADVGQYQLAYQLASALLIIPQAASLALFSRMAALGPDRLWPEQKRMVVRVLGLMVGIAMVAYLLAPWVIPVLAGHNFNPSVRIFQLLLPPALGMSLAQLMTPQWIGRGAFVATTLITITVALVNVFLNIWWIPSHGVMGAVWAAWVCYVGCGFAFQAGFAWWCDSKYKQYVRQHTIDG